MKKRHSIAASLGLLVALAPVAALAHTGQHLPGTAFEAGVLHPLTGFDHLLAMVAVGLWAAALGGAARWIVPASFVALMCVGAALGVEGVPLPAGETFIAASVAVLGLAIAFDVRPPVPAAALLVGLFALFHGHAHGTELPLLDEALAYGAGFVLATVLLHGAGLGLGLARLRGRQAPALARRLAGGALTLCGAALLLGF